MSEKVVLTGNEAIARGFWEAGGKISAAYPGSPTVSITDTLLHMKEVDASWATNEKVAMEMAMGASITGARSLCIMKHVGLNIALDPFMTFTQTRTVGGFVLAIGDDPGLSSSQNEQDSRILAQFANIPVLDPATPQEALDYTKEALRISEQFETPVMVRIMSRLCHARGIVEQNPRRDSVIPGFVEDQANFCMLPPFSNRQQHFMQERMERLRQFNETYKYNDLTRKGHDTLIITAGLIAGVIEEIGPKADVLKLAMVWPLPLEKIRALAREYRQILVAEEMMPVMEKELRASGIPCEGKKYFSFTGELGFAEVREALARAGLLDEAAVPPSLDLTERTPGLGETKEKTAEAPLVERTPMLCAGCPHRPVFDSLKKLKATVVGDIGCYSLGILPPFEVHKTNISMGAALGMALGMAKANRLAGIDKPVVATIGDGTFFHSGLSGLAQLADVRENITLLVLDNRTTAMTGGQKTVTTNEYLKEDHKDEPMHYIPVGRIAEAMGIEDVEVVDQFQVKEFHRKLRDAMKRPNLSVLITTRPCALNFKIVNPPYWVDPKICIACRNCVNTNCPPINMQRYPGIGALKSHIHQDMCVGCSVCSQVCPVNAIKPFAQKNRPEVTK